MRSPPTDVAVRHDSCRALVLVEVEGLASDTLPLLLNSAAGLS